jgi:triosephosphate isomerase
MARKLFLIGNWKLNHNLLSTKKTCGNIACSIEKFSGIDVGIAPVAPFLSAAIDQVKNSQLKIGAQNVFHQEKGAYTGEWSVEQLLDLGCEFSIVGHSERRNIFLESDELINKKVKACLKNNLLTILCVGESLAQREENRFIETIKSQLSQALSGVDSNEFNKLIVAYEPVWAIGTGRSATAQQANDAHKSIRDILNELGFKKESETIRIIYGGSVNPDNISTIVGQPHVDGALVGGASLQPDSFLTMLEALKNLAK